MSKIDRSGLPLREWHIAAGLSNPRISQGAVISRQGEQQIIEPLPYGMARYFGNRPAKQDWNFGRSDGHLLACRGKQIVDLSTDAWERKHNSAAVKLNFWMAADDSTFMEARQLLERSHPRRSPPSGIYLLCSFSDAAEQNAVLAQERRNRNHQDPWSPVWRSKPGPVVGCLVFSRLFHGEPTGREEVMDDASIDTSFRNVATRKDMVDRLGVAWISRIAVDAPYRNCGIGTAMLEEARQISQERLPWPTSYLEVIRTVTKKNIDEISMSDTTDDFITLAGYRRASHISRGRPERLLNEDGSRNPRTEPRWQLYYWCRLP